MVEMTYLAIIGIAMAAMFFGYGFGLFEGRGQGYKKRKIEEEQERKENPERPATPTTITVDDPGLMRIRNENGFLTLDLDGTRVNTSSLSAEQRKRLIEMLNFIRPWLENKPAPAPSMTTPSHPPSPSPVADVRQGTPIASAPSNLMAQPPAHTQDKPSAPAAAKEDRPAAPANSIVAQIDAILQERLLGTPLEGRGIFLAQSPEGGVNVYVGLTRYNGVDDVPDPEIKAAIRAAISEWENRYTPGLK
ncbi:MAG TPA: hypothetical protein VJM08_11470 [Anaerolineales bacterium]|nr:hypothetical protein [Anaerolineales bacterium]